MDNSAIHKEPAFINSLKVGDEKAFRELYKSVFPPCSNLITNVKKALRLLVGLRPICIRSCATCG